MRTAAWQRELDYCTEMCLDNMKNYQVWFHRRACIDALQQPAGELAFVGRVLQEDSKTTMHGAIANGCSRPLIYGRRAVIRRSAAAAGSAQQLRVESEVFRPAAYLRSKGRPRAAQAEADTALLHIARAPSNPSPWAYLRGIAEPVGYSKLPQVRAACEKLGTATAAAATQADAGEEGGGGGGSSSSGPCGGVGSYSSTSSSSQTARSATRSARVSSASS